MANIDKVIWDIERCICHVPDACRDCSRYGHDGDLRCMEALMSDALELLKGQNACENCTIAIEDRVMVVRCKDCKRRGTYECPVYIGGDGMSSEPDDWFCADAERR